MSALKQVFFFFGPDESALKARVQDQFNAGCLEIIDGAVTPMDEVLIEIQTPPLFGSEKLVWVKDLEILERAHPRHEGRLIEVLGAGLPRQNVLILTSSKADLRRKIVLELKKIAHWEEVHLSEEWLKNWAEGVLKPYSKRMDPQAYELLFSMTREDPAQLSAELQKIAAYAGPKKSKIEKEDVLAVASLDREEPFFRFVDQIVEGEALSSLKTLRHLILQGESPLGLVTHLIHNLRILIQARSLIEEGRISEKKIPHVYHKDRIQNLLQSLPKEILSSFPDESSFLKQHPYRVFLFLKRSLNFTLFELRSLFLSSCRAYWELVSSRSAEKVLEILVLGTARPDQSIGVRSTAK